MQLLWRWGFEILTMSKENILDCDWHLMPKPNLNRISVRINLITSIFKKEIFLSYRAAVTRPRRSRRRWMDGFSCYVKIRFGSAVWTGCLSVNKSEHEAANVHHRWLVADSYHRNALTASWTRCVPACLLNWWIDLPAIVPDCVCTLKQ